MKKLYFISMVCAAVMFVSCGKKASVLESSIPNDAFMVTRFDVKSMISKSEYNLFENQTIKFAVEGMKLMLTEPQKKLLESFHKDANSFGIDIKGNSYIFMNEQVIGVLFGVNNAKKVFENFKAIDPSFESMITQEKGVYSVSIEDGVEIYWNKEKMMLLVNYSQYLGVNQEEIDYFNLPKEKSIVSDVNYKKFSKTKGDISFYYAMSNYMNFIKNLSDKIESEETARTKEMFDKMVAIYENFSGIALIMHCNFEKGKIVTSAQTLYATKEDEKRFAELYDYNVKLTGEFLKYIPQNPLFLFAMGFDGEKILAMEEKIGLVSFIDEMLAEEFGKVANFFDYKALIKSIKGDIVISFYNANVENNNFTAAGSAFVKLNNTDAVKLLLDTLNAKIGEVENMPFEFGIKDNFFYLVMKDGLVERENDLMKRIKDQPMFIFGDLTGLNESLKPLYETRPETMAFSGIIGKGLSLVETFESRYIDKDNIEFVIYFTDKKQNSLKQIFGFVDEAINKVASMAGSLFGGGGNDFEYYDEDEENEDFEF